MAYGTNTTAAAVLETQKYSRITWENGGSREGREQEREQRAGLRRSDLACGAKMVRNGESTPGMEKRLRERAVTS